jgi:pimeloyl-ACP methyl ester carboxylesterase
MIQLTDHNGSPVQQHRFQVNGIELHAVTAGSGEPLLLLHGTPKTHSYWLKVLPLLTPHFYVIAPDLRGAGLSGHPPNELGYLSSTVADDMAQLLDALGVGAAFVHGEDRGAEYGFVFAANYPQRVRAFTFSEMMLSGFGLEERSFFTQKNVTDAAQRRGVWEWHVPLFFNTEVAQLLISGKEQEFWSYWILSQAYDPTLIPSDLLNEWISFLSTPHGLRAMLDTYRATLENGKINRSLQARLPEMPMISIAGSHCFAGLVLESLEQIGAKPLQHHTIDKCGHALALEQPERLAHILEDFFLCGD